MISTVSSKVVARTASQQQNRGIQEYFFTYMKIKKNILYIVVFTTTLLMIGGVVVQQIEAQTGGKGGGGSTAGSGDQIQDRDRVQDPTTHDGDEPLQTRDQLQDQDRDRIHLNLETSTPPVGNAQQLQATIQNREQELNQEAAGVAQQYREVVQNENRTRLAVQAIYASQDLLGSVGPQAIQLAAQINNSVQTTTNAEAAIRARSVWARVFFGGDKESAQIIQQTQEQNRARIQALTQLITSNAPAAVQATLLEQIRTMQEEQTRLGQLAQKESTQWGILSWRF